MQLLVILLLKKKNRITLKIKTGEITCKLG